MPPRRKFQNVETPESNRAAVEEIEVRWLADSPSVPHRPHEVVRVPNDAVTKVYLDLGWCVRT